MGAAEHFREMKRCNAKIAVLTAYDAPTARILATVGLDMLLVGDSVGTNVLGYASEREVTLSDMVHHTRAVRRGAPGAWIIADLPFATYDDPVQAVASAHELVAAGADMVKLEGARPDIVRALSAAEIIVAGHLGLEPQNHAERRLRGKTAGAALQLEADAVRLDEAGIALLILELVPEEVAARITRRVAAPTIGIGAGRATDGQVLVVNDAIGLNDTAYRHNRRFAEVGRSLMEAALAYRQAVQDGTFPARANVFPMPEGELALLGDPH